MTKTKRKTKTFVTVLLSGKLRRLEKALVADVQEQYTLGGGLDTVLIMKTGQQYVLGESKAQVLTKITN